ncbi:MAG TPA: T9SS type A sorting domain-containing protein, partial [Bacteroidales bacterium]|nr:T9SS type A sorting domain-containing protein [Bacteroidales bacterium]
VIDLNDWLEDSTLNHGWLLRTASSTVSAKRFNSLENSENPPVLVIQTVKRTPVSTHSQNLFSEIKVYPNPSKGKFIIEGSIDSPLVRIRVFNISGTQVKNIQFQNKNRTPFKQSITLKEKSIYIIEINNSCHKKVTVY